MTRSHHWSIYCLSSAFTALWMAERGAFIVMLVLAIGHAVEGFFERGRV